MTSRNWNSILSKWGQINLHFPLTLRSFLSTYQLRYKGMYGFKLRIPTQITGTGPKTRQKKSANTFKWGLKLRFLSNCPNWRPSGTQHSGCIVEVIFFLAPSIYPPPHPKISRWKSTPIPSKKII